MCRAPPGVVLWAGPPLAPVGIGVIPPQLVSERLVSDEQHRLELVQAVQRTADHRE